MTDVSRHPLRRPKYGWIALACSLAAYLLVSVLGVHQPFHVGRCALRFFDLTVYRDAVHVMFHGASLYSTGLIAIAAAAAMQARPLRAPAPRDVRAWATR